MAEEEFFSFEEALSELRLKEEELKRLVSEGEIRAFREGDTMRLRQSDVQALRNELSGSEVVDLGDVSEELVFEDDVDLGDEAGMATEEISDVDTLIEDDVEDVGELDLDDVEDVPAAAPATSARRSSGARAAAGPAEEEEVEGVGMRFAMIVTTAVMVLSMPVCLAVSSGRMNGFAKAIAGMFGGE